MYRSWWAQRRVDGVFLVDLQINDQRVPVLEELRMPAVVIGTPLGAGSLTAVWQDDAAAIVSAVEYLAGIGHRRIARVTGIPRFWHTKIRTDALAEAARSAGIESVCVEADYTRERGAEATRTLLRGPAAAHRDHLRQRPHGDLGADLRPANGRGGAGRAVDRGLG